MIQLGLKTKEDAQTATELLNSAETSREDILDLLLQIVHKYDVWQESRYDCAIYGISTNPELSDTCRRAIERHKLHDELRNRIVSLLGGLDEGMENNIASNNAWYMKVGVYDGPKIEWLIGKNNINEHFGWPDDEDYNPEPLQKITTFIGGKIGMEDVDDLYLLRKKLAESGDAEQLKVLPEILRGEHDEEYRDSRIGPKANLYLPALYLYANTRHSEEEMIDTLARLIVQYDDPEVDQYADDISIDGLGMEPYLISLCKRVIIEKYKFHKAVRERAEVILAEEIEPQSAAYEIGKENMNRVVPQAKMRY